MVSRELLTRSKEYTSYLADNGYNHAVVGYLVQAVQTAISIENDREYGLELSDFGKHIIEKHIHNATNGGDVWALYEYMRENGQTYDAIDDYFDLLLIEAQNQVLDSYLLYLEKDREPKERFYLPKRKQFLKIGLVQGYQATLDDEIDILAVSLPPGTGKGELPSAKILTPTGFTTFGELRVGDKVIAGNGKVANVTGIYPKPSMPTYKVIFDDGSNVVCSQDHIWHVKTRDDRRRHKDYRNIELNQMLNNFRVEKGKRANYSIPYVPKIEFESKELKIHPYALGVLLGDGGLTQGQIRVSTPDEEILDRLMACLPKECELRHINKYDYGIKQNGCGLKDSLRDYGLLGKHSYEKSIPKDYLYASYADRVELLRGLLDTDGYAWKSGIEYSTTSEQLAEDVRELVHSLGGYCSCTLKTNCGYKKDGEFINCHDSYRLIIQFSEGAENPFFVSRKKEKYKPKRKELIRFIEDIQYVGDAETICIMIDDPCHLYITDDYIITHNTTIEKFFISGVCGWFPTDFSLFFSHSSDIANVFYKGALDIVTSSEYTWNEIFPDLQVTSTNAKMGQFNIDKYKPFPSVQTSSVGAENAGKVRASKYLMLDDLIGKLEEALNKNTLDKLWGVYSVDARQRKTQDSTGKPCKEIHTATRWSVHDVIGRLQRMYEGNPRVRCIAVPDIDPETGESNFDYEYGGFTVEFFKDQELLMDDVSYRCLYKNDPIEREGLLYHEDDLRRYTELPEREPDAILGVCDTKSKGIDFMVLPVFYQYDNDYYLVDCICDDSTDYGVQYERLSNIIVNHKMQQCEFESNAGGDRLAHEVSNIVQEKGGRCNITTKPTETNKETRIIVNSDWIKKHCLFKYKDDYLAKSDYGVFMNQLISYSIAGKNKHDDVPDAMANFALFVANKYRIKTAMIVASPF